MTVAVCTVDLLTRARAAARVLFMHLTALAPIAPPAFGVPAELLGALPAWCLLVLAGVSVLLTATHVIVTQIIRLRASARITHSQDALRVLEIEDLHLRRQSK